MSAPPIGVGTQLGPYRIVAPLGAGGMGEVFRARDERLGRDVAIKVLPSALAADEERLRRFEREAKATSQLNHPNLMAVFDVGSHQGVPFFVCELLEGQTLRSLIAGGPLPARRAVEIATQAARGLAAAHERGVIHRDLKPENVFVSSDGHVTILDFGLARLTWANGVGGPAEAALAVTAAEPLATVPGTVLGTSAYMSPEQVLGEVADARSDLFALGIVLHEMLTGRRPFTGDTHVEMMSAILKEEPPPLAELAPSVPAALQQVVSHCLEKRPAQRFQTARDLEFALNALASLSFPTTALPVIERPQGSRRLLAAVAVVVALVAAVLGTLAIRRTEAPVWPGFVPVTFRRGTVSLARFAPDGQTVLYGAAWEGEPYRVFLKRPEDPEALPLGPPGTELAAVSVTGELAVLVDRRLKGPFSSSGTLARLPLTGGAPRPVLEDVESACWSPDGRELAVAHNVGAALRLEFPIGTTIYEPRGFVSDLRFSPDGRWLAFLDFPVRTANRARLVILEVASRKIVLTFEPRFDDDVLSIAWLPDGSEVLWSGAGEVRAVSRSGNERTLFTAPVGMTIHDVAADGRVLLAHEERRARIAAQGPGDRSESDLSWLTWSLVGDLSSDGRTLLFTEFTKAAGYGGLVALRGVDGSPVVRLGEGCGNDLSPDGRWVLAMGFPPTPRLVLFPTGAGSPRELPRGDIAAYVWATLVPGRDEVVFLGSTPGHGNRLHVQSLSGGLPRVVSDEEIGFGNIWVSPDAGWVLCTSRDGRLQLVPVGGGPARPVPGAQPGVQPAGFSADGLSVFGFTFGELPTRVLRFSLATERVEEHLRLSPADPAGVTSIGPVVLTPDGRGYAYSYFRELSALSVASGLR